MTILFKPDVEIAGQIVKDGVALSFIKSDSIGLYSDDAHVFMDIDATNDELKDSYLGVRMTLRETQVLIDMLKAVMECERDRINDEE